MVFDEFGPERSHWNGECYHCKRFNTSKSWCQSCDPQKIIHERMSGNKDIDNFIIKLQLKTTGFDKVIEWIPFDRLVNVQFIGEGGFGSVFSAVWLDGIRIIENDYTGKDKRWSRKPSCIVALKTLSGSQASALDFLKEFENHLQCRFNGSRLEVYGLTQNTTNEYMMVLQYANKGSLNNNLSSNFKNLTWEVKLKQLEEISNDLDKIHKAGYIHCDFHSGNILQNQCIDGRIISYIADLGLSRVADNSGSENGIYGVMPYVAPEILLGHEYTSAADIYGLGVIMAEMSTGKKPFDGFSFNTKLAVRIINGLRPEFAPGTPDRYIELAMKCMDEDPKKRPDASMVYKWLLYWKSSINTMNNQETFEIKNEFLAADEIITKMSIDSQKHPNSMYTSKFVNTQEIKALSNKIL
ncbi:kinase-like domain-containing protein [Gigaspora rosea]|uniref:Kinase-like domain-containing protein n=1 Tax=Gigaspora rosea TaxID=44941 RepID=A0A397TSN0_9GLOM|nr:kinase-like domain-containing protein [Gigaspora rosea]